MGSGLCAACSKAQAKPRQKAVWERELTSREDALKAVRFAACCYFGLAALDFIEAGFGEPFLYVTALVIVVCAVLVWSVHSRIAAVTLLGLFLFDLVVLAVNRFTSDQKQPSYVPFLLLTFQGQVTIQAVRATFRLHKEYRLAASRAHNSETDDLSRAGVSPPGAESWAPLADAVAVSPLLLTASAPLPNADPAHRPESTTTPPLIPQTSPVHSAGRRVGAGICNVPSVIADAKKRVTSWFAVAFKQHAPVDSNRCPLWNPLAVAGWSLIFTPALGSVLIYLNWMRLGRVKRAQKVALWFWAALAWLVISTVAPPAFLPPLWVYLVFLGVWIGVVAYPQHLSFVNRFTGMGYRRASWVPALTAGCICMFLSFGLHQAIARFRRPPPVVPNTSSVVATATPTPPIDEATRLFSAEEVTQRYRPRIVEVGVAWKVSSGFWFWKSEDPAGSQGSGLLLANDSTAGLIVTNYHVVAAPDSIIDGSYHCAVRQDASQSYIEARCIARAKPPLDLALLAVEMNAKEWEPDAVQIQPLDNLHQGEAVVAIGNALGEGISTTNGVISHFDTLDSQGHRCIRTSAPISPGNSGGPLFTSRGGFFAGITTATRTEERAQNYNMAIPAEYVLDPDNWDFANSGAREIAEPLLKAAGNREHR